MQNLSLYHEQQTHCAQANTGAESRGGCPVPVPNRLYGLCERKSTLNETVHGAQELCESRGGRPGLPVPSRLYGLCGRKATFLKKKKKKQELRKTDGYVH